LPEPSELLTTEAGLLRDEYVALRTEICQSITQQHHILLSGYAAAAAALGFSLRKDGIGEVALLAIPAAMLSMTALWIVECNRMVRASYYIGYKLWPELWRALGRVPGTGWETWIRDEGKFRRRQHWFQLIVVCFAPAGFSLLSIYAFWRNGKPQMHELVVIVIYAVIAIILWAFFYFELHNITDLGASVRESQT
jgi:hypothetical protein